MTKLDTRVRKSNEEMKFSIDTLAEEADIPATTATIPDLNYQDESLMETSDSDGYLVEGLEHTYLLTAKQHASLYDNVPFKDKIQIADTERFVKGIIAFEDIYRKLEVSAEIGESAVINATHLPNHFYDEELEKSVSINECVDIDCKSKQPNKITRVDICRYCDNKILREYTDGIERGDTYKIVETQKLN